MAEAIGIASAVITLASLALNSSIALCNTIKGYRHHPKKVRELIDELQALSDVLQLLADTAITGVDLSVLDIPLRRCEDACKVFGKELEDCTSRSGDDRTSFRDWARLRYMDDDIGEFRQMLAGYKSTITIALIITGLHKSETTIEKLESYRTLVTDTTSDLEDHLRSIDEKLESMVSRNVAASDLDTPEIHLVKEERLSTQQCLLICQKLSDHIRQIQLRVETDRESSSDKITYDGLQECRNYLRITAAKLEKNMLDTVDQCIAKSRTVPVSEDEAADFTRLREEWTTVRHCIDICFEADRTLKENISIIENYATGDDSIQYMVSTDGRTLHGKNRGLGSRPKQVGGHLNDVSLQQISKDITQLYSHTVQDVGPSSQDVRPSSQDETEVTSNHAASSDSSSRYQGLYGPGNKLEPKPVSGTGIPFRQG